MSRKCGSTIGGESGRDSFGALLRRHRSASGFTQEELAGRAGLSVRAIADIERGRTTRPYRGSVRLLADALELSDSDRELFARCSRAGGEETAHPVTHASPRSSASRSQSAAVVPRQLPAATPHFAGRAAEFGQLNEVLAASAGAGGAPRVAAVTGTAGVGKTALATRWARQAADLFADGQLYIDLRGYGPSGEPTAPADAMASFLEALGVPAERIPASPQARSGLYRSLLAGRSMLILLDNARDADQVRPLLPGDPACLVLITSRERLTSLVAGDGACPLPLEPLPPVDAAELLARMLGAERLAAEPGTAPEIIRMCARLPAALAIAAARAATVSGLTLDALARELRATPRSLDSLDTGDPGASLRAVFAWSYEVLSEDAALLFRLLAVQQSPDVSAAAAAELAGMPAARSRPALRELASAHLVTERAPGLYGFPHHLLRAYAAEQARAVGGHLRPPRQRGPDAPGDGRIPGPSAGGPGIPGLSPDRR